jgi:formate dehydrogenase major subunit
MQISRRGFLKFSGATTAGVAVGGLSQLGVDLAPIAAHARELRIDGLTHVKSVCPYCAVGCGQLVYVKDGKIVNLEGDPDCPHTLGALCPKGAATIQLSNNETQRPTQCLYRAAGASDWEVKPLDWMMDRIAERVKKTRDQHFIEEEKGITVNRLDAVANLGSACCDNEECYIQTKLLRTLGLVYHEHQARV